MNEVRLFLLSWSFVIDSFVRILFIVEIEIVRGGLDRISMEILLHGIDCIYLYYIRWYKNIE